MASRYLPVGSSLIYLLLTGVACVPMFMRPDSPLSGVLAVILTLPWSVIVGLPIAVLKPGLVDNLVGILLVTAVEAMLNAVALFWMVGKFQGRKHDQR